MRSYVDALLDLVYPPRCSICGKLTTGALCPNCAPSLPVIRGPICGYCGRPTVISKDSCFDCTGRVLHFSTARSAWIFSGPARELIHELKYRNNKYLAERLVEFLIPLTGAAGTLTWVPLARPKQWARGYNQAKLLAQHLSNATGIPKLDMLLRVRNTADQNQLNPQERRQNVHGAFAVRASTPMPNGAILLVDDVYTTGATVAECARVLLQRGASSVHVATLARAIGE